MNKITLLAVAAILSLWSNNSFAEDGDGRRFPVVIYLVNNGRVIESVNEIYYKFQYDIRSLKAPFFAGMLIIDQDYTLSHHPFGLFTDPHLKYHAKAINDQNGVIEYVEAGPGPGMLMMRGISKKNPKFLEALESSLSGQGYSFARVTYGEPPDLDWRPEIPDAKPFIPFLDP